MDTETFKARQINYKDYKKGYDNVKSQIIVNKIRSSSDGLKPLKKYVKSPKSSNLPWKMS